MSELDTIINRFAKKVDSLNWQSITYQKSAKATHKAQIKKLLHTLIDTDHAHKQVEAL